MRWIVAPLLILPMIFLPVAALGDHCNAVSFRAHQVQYGNHHFVTPHAQVLLVPTAVPYDTFQVTGQAHYPATSVASGEAFLRLQLENERLKREAVERDLSEAKRFTQSLMAGGAQAQQQPTAQAMESPPAAQAEQPGKNEQPTLDFVAHAILKLHCASCHTGDKSRGPKIRGKVQLFDKAGKFALVNTDPGEIWDVIESGHMPLGASEGTRAPVPDHEQGVIKFWSEKKAK